MNRVINKVMNSFCELSTGLSTGVVDNFSPHRNVVQSDRVFTFQAKGYLLQDETEDNPEREPK